MANFARSSCLRYSFLNCSGASILTTQHVDVVAGEEIENEIDPQADRIDVPGGESHAGITPVMGMVRGKACRGAMILQNTAHPPALATLPQCRFTGSGSMSANVETQLKKAQKALSGGQFAEARDGFRQVLERFPANMRAKRGLWVSQSALADAGFAASHPSRRQLDEIAAALGAGNADEAATMAGGLVTSFPRGHGLRNLLGIALARLGNDSEAITAFRAAVELKPNFLEARANLAGRMMAQGDFDAALPVVTESLDMAPEDGTSLNAMTVCLLGLQQYDAALATGRRAVGVMPDHAEAHNNLGLCLRHLGKLDEAIASYRRALGIRPDYTDATLNLGVALVRSGQAEDAIDIYHRALQTGQGDTRLHSNLGLALIETRQIEDAIAQFDAALERDPNHVDASFNKFTAMALSGQRDLAWPHAECRFDSRRATPVSFRYRGGAPAWDGRVPLAGKTLLIHAEQGLGDTLMFMRYMTQLPAETGHIRLAVQDPLRTLIAAQEMPFEVVSLDTEDGGDNALPDFQCPMMSLPYLLGSGAASSAVARLLTVPESHLATWQHRLGPTERARIGFVFRGNPDHVNDMNRSIDLERFLTALPPGPDYHFLGIDLRRDERTVLSRRGDVRTHCEHIADFQDTAALVSQMDKVVCVDTSVAHLAGALGIETKILLPFTPDWRWGLDGEDSFWYASAKLIRQPARGDWDTPLSQVADAIRQLADRP